MKYQPSPQKDIYLIAKRIKDQSKQSQFHQQIQYDDRLEQQSLQALKMIDAYRKIQNIPTKSNPSSNKLTRNNQKQKQSSLNQQPKSTYANKIKQTLKELNANKIREYEKLSQRNLQLKNETNIRSLQVVNQAGFKSRSEMEKKFVLRAAQKMFLFFVNLMKKIRKNAFQSILIQSQTTIEQEYSMSRKYRLFRLFSLWKDRTKVEKAQNQRKTKQNQEKQLYAIQMANEFHVFLIYKKVLKHWSKVTKMQKKKRKYEEQLGKIQAERLVNKSNKEVSTVQKNTEVQPSSANGQLQNKLKGFLNGLKSKIQHKQNKVPLNPIIEQSQESQQASHVFSQSAQIQENQQNQPSSQNLHPAEQQQQPNNIINQPQKQILSNEALQKNRQEIYQRSKNRKEALEKLKKQKELQKKKQQEERKQLEKKIQQENKRIKELKYKEFQQRKKLEKQWEQRQIQLISRANEFNRLRILKFYGFEHWKNIKNRNLQKATILSNTVLKVMTHHTGLDMMQRLQESFQYVLGCLYLKMSKIHERNLKKKCISGMRQEQSEVQEQKIQLEAFHQVHTQKIFLSQWRQVLDILRFENMQEERPLIKKANEYHRVSLMLRSLRSLRENAIESKKEKNINAQKQKIKQKIKGIISEKIEINYDQFL